MAETDDQLARRLLGDVLNGELKWTPDMRLRIATVAQALASLTIVEELRRLNDRGDRLNEALLEFFEKLTAEGDEASPVGSGQPTAARDGQEGGPS